MRVQAVRLVLGLVLGMAVLAPPASALEASDLAVKAAYLFRFGFFVEWPSAAFASPDSPINLCIVGNDPFGAVLDDTVKGQKIGNRPIAVRRMSSVSRDSGCHIVYLAGDDDAHPPQALASLRGTDVLTVTDQSPGTAGIINFVLNDAHVRFDIDDAMAASGGLVISSRLLTLALDVKPRQTP